jgi:hypothetical protein
MPVPSGVLFKEIKTLAQYSDADRLAPYPSSQFHRGQAR